MSSAHSLRQPASLSLALAFGLLLTLSGMSTLGQAAPASVIRGKATVRDGDSLEVAGRQIRLWGVDAPEARQTCRRDDRRTRWPCGREATAALRQYVDGRTLVCRVLEQDRHGREVSRCERAGQDLGSWLVRRGWAIDYRRYSDGAYASDQARAERARAGIWNGSFEAPERYRRRQRRD